VIGPIAVDHASYLGDTPADIALEKAGIIKPGSFAVLAQQRPEVLDVLGARVADVGAQMAVEGQQFAVASRVPGVGGQLLSLQGLAAEYGEVFLPLHGAHQAQNAAVALASVEAFVGAIDLDPDVVRAAFANVTSPGRLEVVRRSPVVVLDAAHNPAGAEALVQAVTEAFTFSPLIGVVGVMADKEVEETRNFTVAATAWLLPACGIGDAVLRWSPHPREGSNPPVQPELVSRLGGAAVTLQGPCHAVRTSLRAFRLRHPAVGHDPRLAGERPAT